MITAIAKHTSAANPEDFHQLFAAQLQALAVNQDLLVRSRWKSFDVTDLLRGQLAHLGDLVGSRIFLDGPHVKITAAASEAIRMAIHALSTSALKHCALSGSDGSVDITWQIDDVPDRPRFMINWSERDGPPVVQPERAGFGTKVLSRLVEMQLDGVTQLDHDPSGLRWQLRCNVSGVIDDGKPQAIPKLG